MECRYCGHELGKAPRFCPKCGKKIYHEKPLAVKFENTDELYIISGQPAISVVPGTVPRKKERSIRFSLRQSTALLLGLIAASAAIYGVFAVPNYIVPYRKYQSAVTMFNNGDFDAARTEFADLGDYKDSRSYVNECRYGSAKKIMENGDYEEAARAFLGLDGYADSDELAVRCLLDSADEYIKNGDYDSAAYAYYAAGRPELAEQAEKTRAKDLASSGDYFAAAEAASEYSAEEAMEFIYNGSEEAMENGDFIKAANGFSQLGDYKDSRDLLMECAYGAYESDYRLNGASASNVRGFYDMGDYKDCEELYIKAAYEYGEKLFENGDYYQASLMFRNTEGYEDSLNMLFRSRLELGKSLAGSDAASAHSVFAMLGNYSDSASRKKATGIKGWYADGYTSANGFCTAVLRKSDTLLLSCSAGTDSPSAPVTLAVELADSEGGTLSAECENVRNSGYFSISMPLAELSPGDAEITVSVKDSGDVLRRFKIVIQD